MNRFVKQSLNTYASRKSHLSNYAKVNILLPKKAIKRLTKPSKNQFNFFTYALHLKSLYEINFCKEGLKETFEKSMYCKEMPQMHIKLFQIIGIFIEHRVKGQASFPCPEIKAKATQRPKRSIFPSLIWGVWVVQGFYELAREKTKEQSSKSVNLNVARVLCQAAAEAVPRLLSMHSKRAVFFYQRLSCGLEINNVLCMKVSVSVFFSIKNKICMFAALV